MPVLLGVFAVILSGCVIGLMVIALAAILGSLRDIRGLGRLDRERRREIH
jgi:Na+-translocating ferredoxin:NAD+ oxidoreductase RnfE subunit